MNPGPGSGEELLRSALNKAELEALEALKLQYFQNATKYLAKGDYDSALLEIKRVLLIDPDHRLAREYETRVTELQASRVQAPKADPVPPRPAVAKETPRVAPPPVTVEAPRPAPAGKSRTSLLYIALIALLLLGTAGILTLEKVEEVVTPVATLAAVTPQVSIPVQQTAESTMVVEEPAPAEQGSPTVEPKRTPVVAVAEKNPPRPEPVRREQIPAPSTGSASAGVGLLAMATEKKVEPSPAPEKKETPMPQPEMKMALTQPPPVSEPVREAVPFVAVQENPKILRLEKPVLPEIVTKNHMSGSVVAKVMIDKDGNPEEVKILSSTSSVFEQPVIDAIGKSSFSPGMMGTGPVAAWVVIPFKFK